MTDTRKLAHSIKREHGGSAESGWIMPTCSCGWRGRKEYAYNDYQYTNAKEQEAEHFAAIRALSAGGE